MDTLTKASPTNLSARATPPSPEETVPASWSELGRRFRRVRQFSLKLCETLEPEDYVIQTIPEASPTKWHRATATCSRPVSGMTEIET